jgi:hypothetical protein
MDRGRPYKGSYKRNLEFKKYRGLENWFLEEIQVLSGAIFSYDPCFYGPWNTFPCSLH